MTTNNSMTRKRTVVDHIVRIGDNGKIPRGFIVNSREGIFGVELTRSSGGRYVIHLLNGDDGNFWRMEGNDAGGGFDESYLGTMIEVLQRTMLVLSAPRHGRRLPDGRALTGTTRVKP